MKLKTFAILFLLCSEINLVIGSELLDTSPNSTPYKGHMEFIGNMADHHMNIDAFFLALKTDGEESFQKMFNWFYGHIYKAQVPEDQKEYCFGLKDFLKGFNTYEEFVGKIKTTFEGEATTINSLQKKEITNFLKKLIDRDLSSSKKLLYSLYLQSCIKSEQKFQSIIQSFCEKQNKDKNTDRHIKTFYFSDLEKLASATYQYFKKSEDYNGFLDSLVKQKLIMGWQKQNLFPSYRSPLFSIPE